MQKPFDIFCQKKFPNEEQNNEVLEQAKNEWNELSSKKKLKFIKKAEKAYDSNVAENPDSNIEPLHTLLTIQELDLLLKSYGLPEKLPVNTREYFIKKNQNEAVQNKDENDKDEFDIIKDAKLEAEKKWSDFTDSQKNEITTEYHKISVEHEFKMIDFIRNLPDPRIVDYKEFILNKKKLGVAASKKKKTTLESPTKKAIREAIHKFIPFEVYLEKHREEINEKDLLKARNLARVNYTALNDKKKLKYIKKAESNYDSFQENDFEKKLFSEYLNKKEIGLLLENYGMPENVPNFSAYYLKMKSKEGNYNMKDIFENFRNLNPDEKKELQKKHAKDLEEYSISKKQFLDKLPPARLVDYENFTKKSVKKKLDSSSNAASPSKKMKKDQNKLNGSKIKVDSDSDTVAIVKDTSDEE